VGDADDVAVDVRPPAAVVVPVEVLGLLEDHHVALGLGDDGRDVVLVLYDAAEQRRPDGLVPAHAEVGRQHVGAVLEPPADILLLQRGPLEVEARGEEDALLLGLDPGHEQRNVVACLGEVGGAEQRVDRRPRHPRQGGGGDDGDLAAGQPQIGGGGGA